MQHIETIEGHTYIDLGAIEHTAISRKIRAAIAKAKGGSMSLIRSRSYDWVGWVVMLTAAGTALYVLWTAYSALVAVGSRLESILP